MTDSRKIIDSEQGVVIYYPNFIRSHVADELYLTLLDETRWQTDSISIFGKTHPIPRLQAWYGEPEAKYSYSNINLTPLPWNQTLLNIRAQIEELSQATFNSVLLNLYRSGADSNGWHSDDEKELGKNPIIASLSLGQKRVFHLKHKSNKTKESILLESGSLLIMSGATQHYWKHQIPKSKKDLQPRINLTFRRIFT